MEKKKQKKGEEKVKKFTPFFFSPKALFLLPFPLSPHDQKK